MSITDLAKRASRCLEDRQFSEAEALYRRMLMVSPKDDNALFMLGMIRYNLKDYRQALQYVSQALLLNPANARYCYNLGVVWRDAGNGEKALLAFTEAVRLNPDYSMAHFNRAVLCRIQGKWEEGLAACDKVIALEPSHQGAYSNKGAIYYQQGKYEEALACYRKVAALNPGNAGALSNLAVVLNDMGQMEEAVGMFREAVELPGSKPSIHSNLLLNLHYDKDQDCASLFEAHKAWDKKHGAPFWERRLPYQNSKDPDKILHIGYVSGDFRAHPVGFFLMGALAHHNPAQIKLHCYHNSPMRDEVTAQLQPFVPCWRDITAQQDDAAEQLIRADGIDILVDLSGHTSDNRLPLFARKPAPVQVSWLGYFNTTGLRAMDYMITDPIHAPAGMETWFTEELIRLPQGYMCYTPPADPPSPAPSPSLSRGYITFGCFNNSNKINAEVVKVWAEVLKAVPTARLILKAKVLSNDRRRQYFLDAFAAEGIDPARLDLRGWSGYKTMLQEYQEVDIALDPFPFSGGLTSCDALFMGVPVITYAGKWMVSRQTASYLAQMGLKTLITDSKKAYIDLAVQLSQDSAMLQALRADLREQMLASSLCDGKGFARSLEAAYRDIWRKWCDGEGVK